MRIRGAKLKNKLRTCAQGPAVGQTQLRRSETPGERGRLGYTKPRCDREQNSALQRPLRQPPICCSSRQSGPDFSPPEFFQLRPKAALFYGFFAGPWPADGPLGLSPFGRDPPSNAVLGDLGNMYRYGSMDESSAAIACSLKTNPPANFSLLARALLVLALSAATTRPARLKTGTETLTRPYSSSS